MPKKRTLLKHWLISIFAWILIVYFYALITVFAFKKYYEKNLITDYMYSDFFHFEIVLTGIILGTLFYGVNRITDIPGFRKRSFGFIITVKSILYFISLAICTVVIYQIFSKLDILSNVQFEYYRDYLLDERYLLSVLLYFFFFIFLMNITILVNKKFGPGVLFDLLKGKYYHPRQEDLILLFIDLKNSTTIAEKLGHVKYSQFIRECVHELTPILVRNQAEVYQYVGDEIVLYWKVKDEMDGLNCLNTFFEFNEWMLQRRDYFNNKYGVYPEFKAGMDCGEVTVTEIGDIKREIAFHGDVLNTASRLEKKCNEYGKCLLVTEKFVNMTGVTDVYSFEYLNDLPLKGKRENVRFYAVSSSNL